MSLFSRILLGSLILLSLTSSTWALTWQKISSSSSGFNAGNTPTAFSFNNQSGVASNTLINSNAVTMTGFTGSVTASCASCTGISYNGGSFVAGPISGVYAGDTIAIQLRSASAMGGSATATATVGSTTSATWTVSTTTNDSCSGSPAVGTVCGDGSIYAGLSPDGNNPMFLMPYDVSNTVAFATCCSAVNTGNTSTITGRANTIFYAARSDSDSPYTAAVLCRQQTFGGHSDWYIPALGEWQIVYANYPALRVPANMTNACGFGLQPYLTSTTYWNGANERLNYACMNGDFSQTYTNQLNYITRCIRRSG